MDYESKALNLET
jgi:hypothetical protein